MDQDREERFQKFRKAALEAKPIGMFLQRCTNHESEAVADAAGVLINMLITEGIAIFNERPDDLDLMIEAEASLDPH